MVWKQLYNLYLSPKKSFTKDLRKVLGYTPLNLSIYERAFQHKSLFKKNNERLEFLGDAILDSVVAHEIYLHFKKYNEGDLSKLRSKAVSRARLNKIGSELQLVKFLKYKTPGTGSTPINLSGNTLEALIGAVYEDQGYDKCYKFISKKILKPYINWVKLDREISDFKSLLFNHIQKNNSTINFELIEESAKSAHKRFEVAVFINGKEIARGKGSTKKNAEQQASRLALKELKVIK